MKSLLNNNVLASVKAKLNNEVKVSAKEVVNGAKFNTTKEVKKANAMMGDVIEAMCGEVLAMEEAMEKAIAEKEAMERAIAEEEAQKVANRNTKIAKAVRVPVNKIEAGIVTPKMNKKDDSCVGTRIEKFLSVCNGAAKYFDMQRVMMSKPSVRMNLQLLASGSASTSTNNNIKEGSMMNMNLQLLSRKVTQSTVAEKNKSLARLLNMNFLNTNNPEVVANAINRVINESNGLTPMVTMATKKEKNNNEDKKTMNVQASTTSVSFGLMMRDRNRFNREITPFTRVLTKYTINGSTMKYTEKDLLVDEFVVLKADSTAIKNNMGKVFYVDFEKGIFATNEAEGVVNLINNEVITNADKLNQYMFLGASASALREKFGFFGGVLAKTYDAKTGASRTIKDLVNNRCDGLMDKAKERYTEIEAAKFATRHMQYDTSSISMGLLGKVAKVDGAFDTGLMVVENGEIKFLSKKGGTFDGVIYMPCSAVAGMFKCNEDVAMEISLQARPGSLKVQVQVVPDELFYSLLKTHTNMGNVTTYGDGEKVSMVFDINSQKADIDLENLELEVLKLITRKPSKPSKGMIEKIIVSALEEDMEKNETNADGSLKLDTYFKVTNRLKELGLTGVLTDVFNTLAGKKLGVSDLTNASAICNKGVNTIPAAITGEAKNTAKSIQNSINKLSYGEGIVDYLTITTDMGMLFGIKLLNEGEIFIPRKSKGQVNRIVAIKYPTMGMREYYSGNVITEKKMIKRIDNAKMPEILRVAFKDEAEKEFKAIKEALKKNYSKMSDALVVLPASMKVFNSCAGLDVDTDAMAIIYDKLFVDTLFNKEEHIELGDLKAEKGDGAKTTKEVNNMVDNIWSKLSSNSNLDLAQRQRVDRAEHNRFLFSNELFFFDNAYINATRGNTESIGSISNSNSKIVAIYIQVLLGKMDGFNSFYKENFGTQNKDAKKEYVGLDRFKHKKDANGNDRVQFKANDFVYFVDEDVIDEIIEEAKEMDVTNRTNVLRLLRDVNRVFRFYQEKTIDIAKTGGTLNVRFSCNSIIISSLVDCNVVDIDNSKSNGFNFIIEKTLPELKEIEVKIRKANGEIVEEFKMNQTVVVDPMAKLQELLIEIANDRLQGLVSEYKVLTFQQLPGQKAMNKNSVLKEVTVKDENGEDVTSVYYDMSVAIEKAHNKLANARGYNTRGLYVFKQLYVELAKQFKAETSKLDPKDDEAIIEAYRNQFKSRLDWIANSCEYILSDIETGNLGEDYVTRGMILLAVGAKTVRKSTNGESKWDNMKVNAINPNSTNKFALNICNHYAKCYALNSNAVTVECKAIECDESLVGQTIELTHGMSDDMKLVVKDKFKSEKVMVNVVKDEESDEIKVLYTEKIKAEAHNENVASIIFSSDVVDAVNSNGEVIVDAGGNARKTVSDVTLANLLKGEYTTIELVETDTDESLVVTKEDGTTEEIDADKELFTDIESNVVYTIGSSFLVGEESEGLVAVELNR